MSSNKIPCNAHCDTFDKLLAKTNAAKLDIHILLDAYFELNKKLIYEPELDETINDISNRWGYFR